jgi:hypothetical protein
MGGARSMTECEQKLDGDLVAALYALGTSAAAATPLSGDGYPGYQPSSYRIDTADGRVLKGRLFLKPTAAEAAERVAWALPAGAVPAALARAGRALVTEWAEGRRPQGTQCTAALLRQCGGLQAAAHLQPIPDDADPDRNTQRLQWHSRVLRERADTLIAHGALAADEARRLVEMAQRHTPPESMLGCIFGDFCPENTIVRPSGEVCFIDHETLAIDCCEYDLARTWYRWPMTAEQRSAFLAGYGARRSLDPFLSHFPFWGIAALMAAAWFRRGRHADAAVVPVARLRSLLADLERGQRHEDIVYRS